MVKELKSIITQAPDKQSQSSKVNQKKAESAQSDFERILKKKESSPAAKEIRFSHHAVKRLKERNISIDGDEFVRLKEAFNKLQTKGGKDSLVITDNAAYIVDVKNNKVVTAIDKDNVGENVFTKIDSTVFMN